jgi:hypothetical protein
MPNGESVCSREVSSTNNDQYGLFISSSKKFLHNQRLLFFFSNKTSIDQTGPFWPIGFPIKYPPPPTYLSRASNVKYSKDYYHFLDTNSQQTYDNQPAIYKYTESLKHAIIYDMEKSPRNQQIKVNDNEQICPQLIFESRFEGGNLRHVRRV